MDLYQAQEFMKNMYKDKNVTFEFDDNCHRFIEIVHTDGKPHCTHHVECRKVKVNIEGMQSIYVPISPHRITTTWVAVKKYLASKDDVHISDDELNKISEMKDDEYKECVKKYAEMSGLDENKIDSKVKEHAQKNNAKSS